MSRPHHPARSWWITAPFLLALLMLGCAESTSRSEGNAADTLPGASDGANDSRVADTPREDTRGVDTGQPVDATATPEYALCLLGERGPEGNCLDGDTLDFGLLAPVETVTRRLRIESTGTAPIEVKSIAVNRSPEAFELRFYQREPDPIGGGSIETEVSLPLSQAPGDTLYIDLSFTAGAEPAPLPADRLIVQVDVGLTELDLQEVLLTGESSGCDTGFADCEGDGTCSTAVDDSLEHCGGCDNLCAFTNASAACEAGDCVLEACDEGWGDCDGDPANGCEIELATSLEHCGGCSDPAGGDDRQCDLANVDEACVDGACVRVGACEADWAACGVDEGCDTDTTTNVLHCGGCDQTCTSTNASAECVDSACVFTCVGTAEDCDGDLDSPGNGCETDTSTSISNCGACGTTCTPQNGEPTCEFSTCLIESCNPGYLDCDQEYDTGCETSVLDDPNNCGGCGVTQLPGQPVDPARVCASPNATPLCNNGICEQGACDLGWSDCTGAEPGCETETATDLNNCGGCGAVCAFANAAESCTDGNCAMGACDADWVDCNNDPSDGCETFVAGDTANCGGCGATQPAGDPTDPTYICASPNAAEICDNGACLQGPCDTGWSDCDPALAGCETQTASDLNNCGGCGDVCAFDNADATCTGGVCAMDTCDTSWKDCDADDANGCETQTSTDPGNCADCGATQPAGDPADPLYICAYPNAAAICNNSNCEQGLCVPGWSDCDPAQAGCETETAVDLNNCGGCGDVCGFPNASASCAGGNCTQGTCDTGWSDCNPGLAGCETETAVDLNNCGGCGDVCAFDNAAESCANGVCAMGACDADWVDCNNDPSDGCETHIDSDTANCGGCGATQPSGDPADPTYICSYTNGVPACNSGVCELDSCDTSWGDCDGDELNGCETYTDLHPNHCGACNAVCAFDNANSLCSGGNCTMTGCDTGWEDCNNDLSDGCETFVSGDADNCGGCGTTQQSGDPADPTYICAYPNAGRSCINGGCVQGACNPGWGDCTGAPGCETQTAIDLNNCGGCGAICDFDNADATCSGGSCSMGACDAGWENCDADNADGCETNTLSDTSNCGDCGATQPAGDPADPLYICDYPNASPLCSGGSCAQGGCDPGWLDCTAAAGCESSDTSATTCGSCGNDCSRPNANVSCSGGGVCNLDSCVGGYVNLDGADGNGCECQITNPTDTPDASFDDSNCDGIDGDINAAVFVAKSGTDTGNCPISAPCETISYAVGRAVAIGKGQVYVQDGTYNDGVLTLTNSISIYGGYDVNWDRADRNNPTNQVRIVGAYYSAEGQYMTVRVRSGANVLLADLFLDGVNASGTTGSRGRSTQVVHTVSSTVTLQRVTVTQGSAASGSSGSTGGSASASAAANGGNGGNADEFSTACNNSSRGGGGGRGTNPSCTSAHGGNGGNGGTMDTDCSCCSYNYNARSGSNGANASTYDNVGACSYGCGGGGGSGGGSCGNPGDGVNGTHFNGSAGGGAASRGRLISNFWYGYDGGSGGIGSHGTGGGGGGGSGGCDIGIDSYGAGGGGGAAGGCRATGGGSGGYGAGGSFGVFAISSTVNASNCTFVRGSGGNGGNGGIGGRGQSGGSGGNGGLADGDSKAGGDGGDGGHGGHGGGGGGGGGGHSAAFFDYNSSVTRTSISYSGGASGSGGSGGASAPTAPVSERDGNAGSNGANGGLYQRFTCSLPGGC